MSRIGIRGPLGVLVFFTPTKTETGTLSKTPPSPPGPVGTSSESKARGGKAGAATTATEGDLGKSGGEYSITAAVKYLTANAHATTQGACTKYVRLGIEAGGIAIPWPRPIHAREYGPTLLQYGFTLIPSEGYVAVTGDVIVLQPPKAGGSGHIQMFDGKIWLSDFRQKADVYPGSAYRNAKVAYEIYRPPKSLPSSRQTAP